MANSFPCPNPSCSHVFSPESVHGVASIQCPGCGSVFRFQTQQSPAPAAPAANAPVKKKVAKPKPTARKKVLQSKGVAPPPGKKPAPTAKPTPTAEPVPPPPPKPVQTPKPAPTPPPVAKPPQKPAPVAQAKQPTLPVAAPVAGNAVPTAQPVQSGPDSSWNLESQNDLAMAPRSMVPRPSSVGVIIMRSLIGLVILGGLGLGGYMIIRALKEDKFKDTYTDEKDPTGFNFKLRLPDKPWVKAQGIHTKLKARLAMRRSNPASFMMLDYEKYVRHIPGNPRLVDHIIRKLRGYFSNLAWQPKPPSTLEDLSPQAKLSGQPAIVLEFEADDPRNVYCKGEVYLMTYRGIVYWLVTWSPQTQEGIASEGWEEVRTGFKLLNGREGWSPQERPTEQVFGQNFRLRFATEVYEKMKSPEDYDPKAYLVLTGIDPTEREKKLVSAGKKGEIRVLIEEKQADLTKAAEFAKERMKKALMVDTGSEVEVEEVLTAQGKKTNGPHKIGSEQGHLARYRAQISGGTFDRFFMIAVINRSDHTLIIRCDSVWSRKDYWEQEFLALLKTIRPRG